MADTLRIALAQLNPTVGDVDGNETLVRDARAKAAAAGADVAVYGELVLSGYPPEDLVYRNSFLARIREAAERLAAETADGGPAMIVGAPWKGGGAGPDDAVYNAVLVLDEGRIKAVIRKHHLPNYGVFDEARVFTAGPHPGPVEVRGVRLGILVCEDMWYSDVAETLAETGAEILVVPNGSPFEVDKGDQRMNHAVARIRETGLPLVYVNQVGGQDELVFDGASFVLNADYALRHAAPGWVEAVTVTDWSRGPDGDWSCAEAEIAAPLERCENVYQAMVLGLRDYVQKNGFPGVILGLSGGIDSALTAAVAVDALGPEKVRCVMMPSPYTSPESLEDADAVAKFLGVRLDEVNIGPAMGAFQQMLGPFFEGMPEDITEENVQSRARGITLMALSNKFGPMVVSTGNKSEMSVGYATLYGDMCGGFNPLKDIYKTTVFAVSHWRNAHRPSTCLGPDGPVMPERVITKPPTAELRPDQKDEDSLPPYPVLDAILEGLIERQMHVAEIAAEHGTDVEVVEKVWRMLNRAEYKRRQAPPGVKITLRSFGRDRRYPITNAYVGPR